MKHALPTVLGLAAWLAGSACAASPDVSTTTLADLPLDELMRIEVVSAGRKAQSLTDIAAAAFVITQDDILRAGVRTLPEALRLAPGVDVAQLSAGRWAVSVRGGAARFANKLLVLVDGRSAYSPLFSGVFWEAERVPVDQIDRIEVIRGPAGAVWGANAVNGVINIITKQADRTVGDRLAVTAGSDGGGAVSVRHGRELSLDSHLRLWARSDVTGTSRTAEGDEAHDRAATTAAGLRWDRGLAGGADASVQAQLTNSRVDDRWTAFDLNNPPGYASRLPAQQTLRRAWVMGTLEQPLQGGSSLRLQATLSMDSGRQSRYADYDDHSLDLDAQHRWQPGNGHDVTWGGGLNVYSDRLQPRELLRFTPERRTLVSWNVYAQDEYALVPQRWLLTWGLRVDRNAYAGINPAPHLRLLWKLDEQNSAWVAASRAVRVPSRGEQDATIDAGVVAPGETGLPLPLRLQLAPSPGREAIVEKVNALEVGWRGRAADTLSLDVTAFVQRYSPLSDTAAVTPADISLTVGPSGAPYLLGRLGNVAGSATTRGLELATDWRVAVNWRLQTSYAFLDVDSTALDQRRYSPLSASPRHLLSMRHSFDLGPSLTLDAWLRHASRRDYGDVRWPETPARTTLDLSARWHAARGLVLSATAHNLGPRYRQEIAQDYGLSQTTEVERALVVKAEVAY